MRPTARWIIVALLAAGARLAAAPRIVVEPPAYDFGNITNGLQVQHDFVVRNTGDAELVITGVVSGCTSCLRASLERTRIPPGGESMLHARLDLRLLIGPVSRVLTLYCNDPDCNPMPVELRGTVVALYQITPAAIGLDLSAGQRTAAAEIVAAPLHAPLSQVLSDNAQLTGQLSQEGPERFVLTVQAAGSFPRGNTAVNLTVRSADDGDPPCRVSVFVHNPPDLELIPEQLWFQAQAASQMRVLWVRQHGATPWVLLDAIAPSDKFQCEIDPDPDGRDYRIYVTASGLDTVGIKDLGLTLKMRDQDRVERAVPVPLRVDRGEPGGR